MKRKELEKLPVLRATTAMLKQAENEPMIAVGIFLMIAGFFSAIIVISESDGQ